MYDRVKLAQNNVKDLLQSINVWANQPLFERKEGKKENLIGLEDRVERIQKRKELVTACSNDLHRILDENCILFLKAPIEDPPPPEPEVPTEPETSPKSSPDKKKDKGNRFIIKVTTLCSMS